MTIDHPVRQALRQLYAHLAERDPAYRYDGAADLARLEHRIRADMARTCSAHNTVAECVEILLPGDRVDGEVRAAVRSAAELLTYATLRITNPDSTLFAARLADGIRGERWTVGWLPERALTREQVIAAMVLDKILIDHHLDSATMMRIMGALSAALDLTVEDALARISAAKSGSADGSMLEWTWNAPETPAARVDPLPVRDIRHGVRPRGAKRVLGR